MFLLAKRWGRLSRPKRMAALGAAIFSAVLLAGGIFYSLLPPPKAEEAELSESIKTGPEDPIVIHFSQRMNQGSVKKAFQISPGIPGELEWKDRKTLLFRPQKPQPIGEQYTVTLSQGARSLYGKKLEAEARIIFEIAGPPQVVFTSPNHQPDSQESPWLAQGQPITIMFDRSMDWSQREAEEWLQISPPVPGRFLFLGRTAFQFFPDEWPEEGGAELVIPAGLPAEGGGKSKDEYRWRIASAPMHVTHVSPRTSVVGTQSPLQITFSRAVDLNQVKPGDNLLLFPSNDLNAQENLSNDGFLNAEITHPPDEEGNPRQDTLAIAPTFPFQAGKEHRLVVKAGLDELAEDFEWIFQVEENPSDSAADPPQTDGEENFSPSLAWADSQSWIYVSDSSQSALELMHKPNESVTVEFCSLNEKEFIQSSLTGQSPKANCGQKTELPASAETQASVDLKAFLGQEAKQGFYLIRASQGQEAIWKGLMFSRTLLNIKKTSQDLLVWALDTATLQPVPQMGLTILDAQGEPLAQGVTDGGGIYRLIRPLPEDIFVSGQKKSEDEDRWTVGSPRWLAEEKASATMIPELWLTADSNQKKPGQAWQVKGIWRKQDQSLLQIPQETSLTLILSHFEGLWQTEQSVELKEEGHFDLQWNLPSDMPEGLYQLSALAGEAVIPSSPLALQVQEAANSVHLEWPGAKEAYADGSAIILTLKADYFPGFPAANLAGQWELHRGSEKAAEGNLSLNHQGLAQVIVENLDKKGDYTLSAKIYDASGQISFSSHSFQIAEESARMPVKSAKSVIQLNEPLALVMDPSQEGLISVNQRIELKLAQEDDGRVIWKKSISVSQMKAEPLEFDLPEKTGPGKYVLSIEGADGNGKALQSQEEIMIYDSLQTPVSQEAFVLCDQPTLSPNQDFNVWIHAPQASPQNPVAGLLTLEKGQVLEYRNLSLTQPLTQVPFTATSLMLPQIIASLQLAQPSSEGPLSPIFQTYRQTIQTEQGSDALSIDIKIEPAKKAGEGNIAVLKVTNAQGQPAPSLLAVQMADRPVLPIQPPSKAFQGQASSVPMASALSGLGAMAQYKPFTDQVSPPSDTWSSLLFEPFIKTDDQGEASLSLPNSPHGSSWFLHALAAQGNQFGWSSIPLSSDSALQVEPLLPPSLSLGDWVELATRVTNKSSGSYDFSLELTSPHFKWANAGTRQLSLEAGESTILRWPAQVTGFNSQNQAELTWQGDGGRQTVSVPIRGYPTLQGVFGGKLKEKISTAISFQPPFPTWKAGGMWAGASGSLAAFAQEAWIALTATASSQQESAMYGLLGKLLLENKGDPEPELSRLIQGALPEGGYAVDEKGRSSDLASSSMALLALNAAAQKGHDVPAEILEALKSSLWTELEAKELARKDRLFALWALSEAESFDTPYTLEVFKDYEQMEPSEQALLLMTLSNLERAGQKSVDPFIQRLLAAIATAAVGQENGLSSYFDDAKTDRWTATAMILYALRQADDQNALLPEIEAYLSSKPLRFSPPFSREEWFWSLWVLSQFEQTQSSPSVGVSLNGRGLKWPENGSAAFADAEGVKSNESNSLAMEAEDDMYAFAQLLSYPLASSLDSAERGGLIRRVYRDWETGQRADRFVSGRFYEAELTVVLPQDSSQIRITSPVPTGLKAISLDEARSDNGQNLLWSLQEARLDEHEVMFYASSLPAGVYTFRYTLQAGLPGTFSQWPAQLESLYSSALYARTPGQMVTVEPAM